MTTFVHWNCIGFFPYKILVNYYVLWMVGLIQVMIWMVTNEFEWHLIGWTSIIVTWVKLYWTRSKTLCTFCIYVQYWIPCIHTSQMELKKKSFSALSSLSKSFTNSCASKYWTMKLLLCSLTVVIDSEMDGFGMIWPFTGNIKKKESNGNHLSSLIIWL